MSELIIKNGFVFDPLQGIKGDRMDIGIKDGKIVETSTLSNPKTIDATGMTVMAGGVDVHSHVVGPKVNVGRLFRPEDKLFKSPLKRCSRMEMGFSVPSTFKTGYDYARMGYVFVNEAAMPPLHSPHVHEEIRDTPIIDNAAMPVFGNNWFTLEYLKNHEIENNAAYTAWLLRATRGFGIKVVNPGGHPRPGSLLRHHAGRDRKRPHRDERAPRPPALSAPALQQSGQPGELRRHARIAQARRGLHCKERLRP